MSKKKKRKKQQPLWQLLAFPVRVSLAHAAAPNTIMEFRRPTARDIDCCGNPVRVDSHGEIVLDEAKMTRMIAALSGIKLAVVEMMDARDWNSCAYRLRLLFLPDPNTWKD